MVTKNNWDVMKVITLTFVVFAAINRPPLRSIVSNITSIKSINTFADHVMYLTFYNKSFELNFSMIL